MINQLETHYLEQQLRKAEQEKLSHNWGLAFMHYQRAYNEARWLCDHFINGECARYAEQALSHLHTAALGCIDCSDSPTSTNLIIEADLKDYKKQARYAFGSKFSHAAFTTTNNTNHFARA